ncbi:hypothetical protein KKC13_05760 [bacterium]|nr:hypothetical protein [bacterium]MBU1957887.1 hypothetical protein [bacterium]
MKVNKSTLKILAAIVWYGGFIALSLKSYKLFSEAYSLDNNVFVLTMMLFFGLFLALLKTKYIFIKSCQKNLKRIAELKEPKVWQFYRVRFFIFLVSMIGLGAYLSSLAHGNYWFLLAVGVVDMALALALLLSSFKFWK